MLQKDFIGGPKIQGIRFYDNDNFVSQEDTLNLQ